MYKIVIEMLNDALESFGSSDPYQLNMNFENYKKKRLEARIAEIIEMLGDHSRKVDQIVGIFSQLSDEARQEVMKRLRGR